MVKKKRQADNYGDDGSSTDSDGGPKSPNSPGGDCCQHVKRSVDITKLRKQLKQLGISSECSQCSKTDAMAGAASPAAEANEATLFGDTGFEYDNTLWLCLKCGTQLCGRSKNQHALQHFKTPHSDSHALTMNTRSFEIWCYECDNEVTANARKNLLECVEVVKKFASQEKVAPAVLENGPREDGEAQVLGTNKVLPLPPPPPPIPGIAKRVNGPAYPTTAVPSSVPPSSAVLASAPSSLDALSSAVNALQSLPRVRGLTNLGNTCFFNAVMQCLAQTPYLLDVLKESDEAGEEFILPGGTFKFKDEEDVELPMIKGKLSSWGGLTSTLAQALEELQSGGGVFTPSKLFEKLCSKCPQFRGGDQHDSHELLRHLLESVRSEDLKRYQRVILQDLGYKDQDINNVSDEMRQKCKIYGNQAADRILRPEQVFRGFLVSTLTCQECYNVSSRHEYFLDISLPVAVERGPPPQRRKASPDNEPPSNSFFLNRPSPGAMSVLDTPVAAAATITAPVLGPTKSQLKREKEKERKAKRAAKHHNNKLAQKRMLDDVVGALGDFSPITGGDGPVISREEGGSGGGSSSSSSSAEQSDADIEDNLMDDNTSTEKPGVGPLIGPLPFDSNGNGGNVTSPGTQEKRGDSPENIDKDSLDEDENDSGIATSPANAGSSFLSSSETNGGGASSDVSSVTVNNSIVAVGLSEKGASMVRQLSQGDGLIGPTPPPLAGDSTALTNGNVKATDDFGVAAGAAPLDSQFDQMQLGEQKAARMRAKRVRTQSHSDWSTTIAPRYQCEDGECSVQSCLNSFTSVELLTGSNKVGCESCTKRINGDDPTAKTVNTNATKQFLISSPPAVLILHLKRFQLGPRCMFRKLTRMVTFAMVLDIAPFCGSKVKNLPNIDRKQKKLLYSLYGIVEHAGSMYGGHYTAYVKVRPKLEPNDKRWKFIPQGSKAELDQDDEQRKKLEELLAKEKARELRLKAADDSDDFSNSGSSSSSSEEMDDGRMTAPAADHLEGAVGGDEEARNVEVPLGKWYYVSDSHVQEVSEEQVLRAQAYLLFYERIY